MAIRRDNLLRGFVDGGNLIRLFHLSKQHAWAECDTDFLLSLVTMNSTATLLSTHAKTVNYSILVLRLPSLLTGSEKKSFPTVRAR